jgi:hypothetical protein
MGDLQLQIFAKAQVELYAPDDRLQIEIQAYICRSYYIQLRQCFLGLWLS